ncbi:pyridoxal phosphate-dependent aminotransferase [Saliphagus sp. LR7]|uniref:pyridoxal phosphate-dependent aminotransferase n=1 Tax=Saliphagus sp. LR7 TaxID=2282654 RepID=UPI000DF7A5D8|nr:pyridoxal phosphate-dependent aminotransferase [Saliphagus sp. LR7]
MSHGSSGDRISARAAAIGPQRIRAMFDRAARLESEDDRDLVHLELGEPDFDTPAHVVRAADEAARAGRTNYTANAGLFELREAIADSREPRPDPATEVIVTNGGVEAFHLALETVCDPGDEVVVPTPAWPNPISQARMAGAEPIEVPMPAAEGFSPDPDRIVAAIGPETAAVILTSPANPTGRTFGAEGIRRVLEAAADHSAFVIADEVYRGLTYTDVPPPAAAIADDDLRQWLLTVDSCSKRYAMTGWRVGWLVGSGDVVGAMTGLREHTTSSTNAPAQYAAIAALTGPEEPIEEMARAFARRRDLVCDRVDEIPGVSLAPPEGAFYAFLDVSDLEGESQAVADRLLEEYGVVTAPGTAFGAGGEGHLRLSFAAGIDRLEEGLDRLERTVRDERGAG